MISFDQLSMEEGSPIYLQIIQYVKRGMVGGTIADGDEFPSRRVLSALLGVNPNTIQKAYRCLEEEGLMQSRAGAKSYAALTDGQLLTLKKELQQETLRPLIRLMKESGLDLAQAQTLMSSMWEDEP